MEWFDDEFFKALERAGFVMVNKKPKETKSADTNKDLQIKMLKAECEFWKRLYELERDAFDMLSNANNILSKLKN